MKVWVLFDTWNEEIIGVYETEEKASLYKATLEQESAEDYRYTSLTIGEYIVE